MVATERVERRRALAYFTHACTMDITETVTFRQNWSNYNAAQEHEGEHFIRLLRTLCDLIEQPPQTKGRPRLPLSDAVFAFALKVYGTMSMRRSMTDVRNTEVAGLMDKAPSRGSALRYM